MSLINKMLQDLDARGGAGAGAALQSNVKSVAAIERRMPWYSIAAAGGLTLVLAAAGYAGWRYVTSAKPVPPRAPPIAMPRAAPVVVAPAIVAPEPAVVSAPLAPEEIKPPKAVRKVAADKPAKLTRKQRRAEKAKLAASKKSHPSARPAPAAAPAVAAPASTTSNAEAVYRRALASLQEGRAVEAMALLEQSLAQDAHHEAARQTLVGLLIENRRPDEAMRQMQAGLALEPRQLSMAMLLARMQIERGGNGIDTLMRSLPFAGGNGDYHAFLAGALQRQQRHREAAEQYLLALRGAPQQGLWLMGLGISLQAEKRNAEALAAFQRAKASNSLSADLQSFVERKLQQLER